MKTFNDFLQEQLLNEAPPGLGGLGGAPGGLASPAALPPGGPPPGGGLGGGPPWRHFLYPLCRTLCVSPCEGEGVKNPHPPLRGDLSHNGER